MTMKKLKFVEPFHIRHIRCSECGFSYYNLRGHERDVCPCCRGIDVFDDEKWLKAEYDYTNNLCAVITGKPFFTNLKLSNTESAIYLTLNCRGDEVISDDEKLLYLEFLRICVWIGQKLYSKKFVLITLDNEGVEHISLFSK